MNKLINILKDTGVEMNIRVDERGAINVGFSKDDYRVKKFFSPNEYSFSELTIEDRIIYALKDFLGGIKTNEEL